MSRTITRVIVHSSATRPDMDIGASEIRRWHVDGNGWADIGYHLVIRRNGTVEDGRQLSVPGAHAQGHNHDSIGICLVGGVDTNGHAAFNFTRDQLRALEGRLNGFIATIPGLRILGHRDVGRTECPSFDVGRWWYGE